MLGTLTEIIENNWEVTLVGGIFIVLMLFTSRFEHKRLPMILLSLFTSLIIYTGIFLIGRWVAIGTAPIGWQLFPVVFLIVILLLMVNTEFNRTKKPKRKKRK